MSVYLVTGSRSGVHPHRIREWVATLRRDTLIIHGGCKGVDLTAAMYAQEAGIHTACVDALWGSRGRGAGPQRNRVMVEMCKRMSGSVVAFRRDDGQPSRGTDGCIKMARDAGLEVVML